MKCFTLEMTEQLFEAHLNVNCAWCRCDKMIWLEAPCRNQGSAGRGGLQCCSMIEWHLTKFQLSISCFASFLVFACWGITQSVFCLCVPPSELQMSPFHWCIEAFFSSVAPGASQWGWGPLMDCSVCLWATCSSAKSPHSKAFWLNRLHGCFQADGNKNSHYGPRRPVITYSVTDL